MASAVESAASINAPHNQVQAVSRTSIGPHGRFQLATVAPPLQQPAEASLPSMASARPMPAAPAAVGTATGGLRTGGAPPPRVGSAQLRVGGMEPARQLAQVVPQTRSPSPVWRAPSVSRVPAAPSVVVTRGRSLSPTASWCSPPVLTPPVGMGTARMVTTRTATPNALSPRARSPSVAFRCAAVSPGRARSPTLAAAASVSSRHPLPTIALGGRNAGPLAALRASPQLDTCAAHSAGPGGRRASGSWAKRPTPSLVGTIPAAATATPQARRPAHAPQSPWHYGQRQQHQLLPEEQEYHL